MDYLLGMNAKLYFGSAYAMTGEPPEWPEVDIEGDLDEIGNVKDLTLSLEAGEADITTRENSGWRATAPVLKEAQLEFEMQWKPGDAAFEAVRDAYINGTTLALAALTEGPWVVPEPQGGPEATDAEGPVGNWSITNFSRNESLEEAITVSVTAKLSAFVVWYGVAEEE